MLKSCAEEDHETANALILAAGMQMPQNSLTLVVDETGMYYRVPICVINDPENFNADFQTEKLKSKVQPKEIRIPTVKIRNAAQGDCTITKVSNLITIEELKQLYIQNNKDKRAVGLTVDRIRFFVMGKEMKNDLFVYSYEVNDNLTI